MTSRRSIDEPGYRHARLYGDAVIVRDQVRELVYASRTPKQRFKYLYERRKKTEPRGVFG